MDDIFELYQQLIIDHSRSPRNLGSLPGANCRAEGRNPLCGDHCKVHVEVENKELKDIRFEGQGCAISQASSSLMTDLVKGKSVGEAHELAHEFYRLVKGEGTLSDKEVKHLDKLVALSGVSHFPVRVKCATLPWHTLEAALDGTKAVVKTEE